MLRFFNRDKRNRDAPAQETNPPTPANKPPDNPSRREFLKFLGASAVGAVAAGAAAETGLVRKVFGAEQPTESFETPKEMQAHIEQQLQARPELYDIYKKSSREKTLEETDMLRDWFDTRYPYETLRPFLEAAVDQTQSTDQDAPKHLLSSTHKLLHDFDAHGLLYRYYQEYAQSSNTKKHHQFDRLFATDRTYYAVRTKDFLPDSSLLREKDIEPRLWKDQNALDNIFTSGDVAQVDMALHEYQGWTHPTLNAYAQQFFSDLSIRERLQSLPDVTLAEAFSLCKSVARYKDIHNDVSDKEALDILLKKRETFLKKEIIGPSTDTFVYVYGKDVETNAPLLRRAVYMAHQTNDMTWDEFGAEPTYDTSSADEEELIQSAIEKKISDTLIAKSRGKTVVYLNAHGNEQEIVLGKTSLDKNISYPVSTLAEALLSRITQTQDPATLGDMTLMVDACTSYSFGRALHETLRDRYITEQYEQILGVSIEDISFPTIITSVHAGGIAFEPASFKTELTQYTPNGTPVSGADILRRYGPRVYSLTSDIAVMYGEAGRATEIGQTYPEDTPSVPA